MAQVTGGQNLGRASGSIVIDTSQLRSAAQTVRQAGQQMRQSLDQTATGAARVQGAFRAAIPVVQQLGAVLGVAIGAATVRQVGAFALAADQLATSYRRQSVAAVNLAGSQQKLNQLLAAYERVTGGAVSRARALADVTNLMAVGFADTAQELERFVSISRGISIATGRGVENVLQILQLAIANTSVLRLNELGLSIEEVTARIQELQDADSSLTREMAFQIAVLGLAETKYGALARSAEAQATGAERAARAWEDFRLAFGEFVGPGISNVLNNTTATMEDLGKEANKLADSPAIQFFRNLGIEAGVVRAELEIILRLLQASGGLQGLGAGVFRAFLPPIPPSETIGRRTSIGAHIRSPLPTTGGSGALTLSEEQEAVILDRARAIQSIERAASDARIDATEQYERQRTETIRSYEQSIAREAEDFARQRARQLADLERGVARVREDATRREALAERDFGERVVEIRTDAAKRLADLEERFQRDRVRAERNHRDRLLDAAARLDAAAVFEQQRSFNRQRQDAEENLRDQRADIQEQLSEREQQEQRSHRRRLEDAREADARRIDDMRASFELQREREDEDRAIRLRRQAEDFQQQLAQQDSAHQLRLAQISRHAARERAELDQEFFKELERLGLRNEKWYAEQQRFAGEAISAFRVLWSGILATFAELNVPQTTHIDPIAAIRARGEFPTFSNVLPAGSSSRSVTVAPGAIVVNAAPGQSEIEIAREVDARLTALLNSLAGP